MGRISNFIDEKPLTSVFIFIGFVPLWLFEYVYLRKIGMKDYSDFIGFLPIVLLFIRLIEVLWMRHLKNEWK